MYDLSVGDDDMGDDDMGDDDMGDDIVVGGRGRRKRKGNKELKVNRIQPVNQTQACNFPQGPNGALVVTAGTTGTLTARPQRPFQTERFVLPSSLSPFFAINDLVIGRDSMFVNSEAAHGDIFSQTGVGVALLGYIARPGIDITLTVTNIDVADHPFYASIIGPAWV
jgi:hypothetical protein